MWSTRSEAPVAGRAIRSITLVIGGLVLLCGCAGWQIKHPQVNAEPPGMPPAITLAQPSATPRYDILEASYAAADILANDLQRKTKAAEVSLIAASFVDINDLEQTCPLGRLLSEQMSSRLAQHGFRILEMKLRLHSIYIKEGKGEFLLSRDIKKIGESHSSRFVLVGTYAVAERGIYVSARIVDTIDNAITTGYDFQLERNFQTESLMNAP